MARPKKQTIEYFPHYVNHHKTMFVLESKYGNDGYAFWFKTLELLGSTNGMVYDCNNVAEWEFLLAKTHLNEESANNILDILADLEAIDKDLWKQKKIIWSQNLVDNIADAFKRRTSEMPQKPLLYTETPVNEDNCIQKPFESDVSANRNGETKRKETKLKETKQKETIVNEVCSCSEEFLNEVINYYCSKAFILETNIKSTEIQTAISLLEEVPVEIIKQGIDEAFKNYKPKFQSDKIKSFNYCEPVIRALYAKLNAKEGGASGTAQSNIDPSRENIGIEF